MIDFTLPAAALDRIRVSFVDASEAEALAACAARDPHLRLVYYAEEGGRAIVELESVPVILGEFTDGVTQVFVRGSSG